MNLLHKLTGLSLVLALCAALMAGCGSTADTAAVDVSADDFDLG